MAKKKLFNDFQVSLRSVYIAAIRFSFLQSPPFFRFLLFFYSDLLFFNYNSTIVFLFVLILLLLLSVVSLLFFLFFYNFLSFIECSYTHARFSLSG